MVHGEKECVPSVVVLEEVCAEDGAVFKVEGSAKGFGKGFGQFPLGDVFFHDGKFHAWKDRLSGAMGGVPIGCPQGVVALHEPEKGGFQRLQIGAGRQSGGKGDVVCRALGMELLQKPKRFLAARQWMLGMFVQFERQIAEVFALRQFFSLRTA